MIPSSSEPSSLPQTGFRFTVEELRGPGTVNVYKYRPLRVPGDLPVTYTEALRLMQDQQDKGFIDGFLDTLRSCPFPAYFFETPPATATTAPTRPFEFVLVDAPVLAKVSDQPDPKTFSDHMKASQAKGEDITSFLSLGRDATLICPCQTVPQANTYTHLAQFSRYAPRAQQEKLWAKAASIIEESFHSHDMPKSKPLWWSTSGLGVYWVHVRVDTRPKYYTWNEYKNAA